MKLHKEHPIIVAANNGNLHIGKTFNSAGVTYEVMDYDFNSYDVELINKLSKWRKKRK